MIDKSKVLELIEERIAELDNGLFIVDLSISDKNEIQVELDKHEGGVSVNDCISVSRNVEHNLDREDADFELHVSSAGIDRPLRVLPQYIKNIGREVEFILKDGKKKEGVLVSATEEEITVEHSVVKKIEGKKKKETIIEQTVYPLSSVKETKIVISFK
jgi:ribosome maturation factor RimP